jgi:hypothetical protein
MQDRLSAYLHEEEEYLETQNRLRVRNQLKILLKYLEEHDPKMLLKVVKMMRKYSYLSQGEIVNRLRNNTLEPRHMPSKETRRLIRKMIGETHWTLYLEYYKQYLKPRGDRTKIELTESDIVVPLPPPFPTLSMQLDEHVTSHIFGYLSGKDMYEASKVSREFRDSLIPRQKNVTTTGFSSFESFRQMNFIGMESFAIGESSILTNENACVIASDQESYPNLSRASLLSSCCYLLGGGEMLFMKALGPRLEKLSSSTVTVN